MIRKALTQIPVERLVISTGCGFGQEGMSRRHTLYKMASIVMGTNIVRGNWASPSARAGSPACASP